MKKKVFLNIFEYACERREIDAQKISNFLKKNNYEIVTKPEKADIIFFLSCGIIEKNTEACLQYIKEYQNYKAELIIGGCGPGIDKERIKAIHQGSMISTKDLDKLDTIFPNEKFSFDTMEDATDRFSTLENGIYDNIQAKIIRSIPIIRNIFNLTLKILFLKLFGKYSFVYLKAIGLKKAYYIKISEGCLGKCSYCSLPLAIGSLKSKPLNDCIDEFQNGLNKGYTNFFITADDTGAYGTDNNTNIGQLLDTITGFDAEYTILISSLNPIWLVKYIDEIAASIARKKINCIVVPVQSGNPHILERMGRYSDIEKIKEAIIRLKQACDSLWISTHVLVGFPSETEKELHETLDFVNRVPFDEVQLFAYSMKPGTEAEKIEPKISEDEISKRMRLAWQYFRKKKYRCYFHESDFLYVSKLKNRRKNING
ncbi:MAG: radical SAM protein [bacterium]|nr:radical SAM protein [bacterium]